MTTPYLGEIRLMAISFAPKGWAPCYGQLLPINQNQALFALLGTMYGGDGIYNFALPDLRGRAPVHAGSTPGSPTVVVGERGGVEQVALTFQNNPSHSHSVQASTDVANTSSPAGAVLGAKPRGGVDAYASGGLLVGLGTSSTTSAGGGQPHNNMQPSLVLGFYIALQGIFPPRS